MNISLAWTIWSSFYQIKITFNTFALTWPNWTKRIFFLFFFLNILRWHCVKQLFKRDKGNVMNKLYEIAENCVLKTGFYQNFPKLHANELANQKKNSSNQSTKQTGIVRVNCVDCLDRTNTAMYVIGKCAMAHQVKITTRKFTKKFIFKLLTHIRSCMLLELYLHQILALTAFVKSKIIYSNF